MIIICEKIIHVEVVEDSKQGKLPNPWGKGRNQEGFLSLAASTPWNTVTML